MISMLWHFFSSFSELIFSWVDVVFFIDFLYTIILVDLHFVVFYYSSIVFEIIRLSFVIRRLALQSNEASTNWCICCIFPVSIFWYVHCQYFLIFYWLHLQELLQLWLWLKFQILCYYAMENILFSLFEFCWLKMFSMFHFV